MSARSIDRIIKVARTIADLLGQDAIDRGCLIEAAGFRAVDPTADVVIADRPVLPAPPRPGFVTATAERNPDEPARFEDLPGPESTPPP
jgi:hypothetical protein